MSGESSGRGLLAWLRIVALAGRLTYRFWSGHPMGGERKTDATFWRPASRSLDPSGTALRWEMMRGAARLAYRLAGCYLLLASFVLALAWMLPFTHEWAGHVALGHLAVFGLGAAVYVTVRGNVEHGYSIPYPVRVLRMEERSMEEGEVEYLEEKRWEWQWLMKQGRLHWEKTVVVPLARALSTQLNTSVPSAAVARSIVNVPRNYVDKGGIVVSLPATFTGADVGAQKRLVATVRNRLGITEELVADWQLTGEHPRAVLNLLPMPPALVLLHEVQHYLDATDDMEFFYGVTPGGDGFSVKLAADTPHDAVSAGSGAGKSELLKLKIMQALHRGWSVIVLDWKEESQAWCQGLPGVRYAKGTEDIHNLCTAVGDEIEWRKAHTHREERPPLLVVCEEWNATSSLLTDYWSSLRSMADVEERRSMPLRSPATSSIMRLVFTGRSLMMFNTIVAIRFSARTMNGNADIRESFGVIHMARYSTQTVNMLAKGVKPFPKRDNTPGRWVAVKDEQAIRYQAPLITDEEARAYALAGQDSPMSPWMLRGRNGAASVGGGHSGQGTQLRLDATGRNSTPPDMDGEEVPPVTLRKLSDIVETLEYLGITRDVLRNASRTDEKGDPSFPAVQGGSQFSGYLYDVKAVTDWARRKRASEAAEKVNR